MMTPTVVYRDALRVAGLSVRTNNPRESHHESALIPQLWGLYRGMDVRQDLINAVPNSPEYAVYHDYANGVHGDYTVCVGVEITELGLAPLTVEAENVVMVEIPAGQYLKFETTANQTQPDYTQLVPQLWRSVWAYLGTHFEVKRRYEADFEQYAADGSVAIYIGISA